MEKCRYVNIVDYFFVSIVSHSAINDMMTLDKEIKKQTPIDHNEDHFYDCFDEAKTAEVLQIMSK